MTAALLAATLASCTSTMNGSPQSSAAAATSPKNGRTAAVKQAVAKPSQHPAQPVHASLLEADDHTYGVGMPIVMRFSKKVTDARAFNKAVKVTVNGQPANGAWYWERSPSGFAMEAHYRTQHYWPAHSRIEVDAPLNGVSAGQRRAFDDNLTLSIKIGAAHVSTVDANASSPHMVVKSDGQVVKTMPVSLGKPSTPTYRGTKIVEEFDRVQNMHGLPVPWSVRLTNTGEFVHAASWNYQIGQANTSDGCTNLSTTNAEWFYRFSLLGDVVEYPNAPGIQMRVWDGLGDWNTTWSEWRAGGLL